MGDYNDHKLPDPCLRLDFGGGEYNSIELGEGTGYVKLSFLEDLRERIHDLESIIDGGSIDNEHSAFVYKMDCLICELSNGMISKSRAENSVIKSVIEEEFAKDYEEFYEDQIKQAENDLDTLRQYTIKLCGLLIKTYQIAYSVYVRVPLADKTVEDVHAMSEVFESAKELGIEIDL